MIVFPLISLLMFWIAILLYYLDKRQLMSCKIAVAAAYIVIAYIWGLGLKSFSHIVNRFIVMSMIVFLIVLGLVTVIAIKKDVFQQYQKKANFQRIGILAIAYGGLGLLLVTYFPGVLNLSLTYEIRVLLGGIVVYLVWNVWSYLLHLFVYPKHMIREFPSYIVISDLYDIKKSVSIAKGIYEFYQKTAIMLIGVSDVSCQLVHYVKEEFSSNTAIVQLCYDGTTKDLLKETKKALDELDIMDEGIIVTSEEDYLRLGLLAKEAQLESDMAIILAEPTDHKLEMINKHLRAMLNCFAFEANNHYFAIALIVILATIF